MQSARTGSLTSMPEFITFWIVLPAGVVIGSILHECGHWAAAVALRCEPLRRVLRARAADRPSACPSACISCSALCRSAATSCWCRWSTRGATRVRCSSLRVSPPTSSRCSPRLQPFGRGAARTRSSTPPWLAFAGAQAIGVLEFSVGRGGRACCLTFAYAPLVARYKPERRPARIRTSPKRALPYAASRPGGAMTMDERYNAEAADGLLGERARISRELDCRAYGCAVGLIAGPRRCPRAKTVLSAALRFSPHRHQAA